MQLLKIPDINIHYYLITFKSFCQIAKELLYMGFFLLCFLQ